MDFTFSEQQVAIRENVARLCAKYDADFWLETDRSKKFPEDFVADMAAAGNICTEDMVFMCHELGIETGIDLEALIEAARLAERIIGRPLMGKCMHSGSLHGAKRVAA